MARGSRKRGDAAARQISRALIERGFTVHRYDAISTSSIYLKVDWGAGLSIRMAVHDGEAWQVVRTCRNIGFETGDDFKCSACGEAYNESDDMAMPASRIDWCFSCGAKVVG